MPAALFALLLGLLKPTPSATPAPTPTPVPVPWTVDCGDEPKENGYLFDGYCVPGVVTEETARFQQPRYFSGAMSSYTEGVMERVASNRGMGLSGYKGGVALMGCGDIGKSVYVRPPGGDWYGPLLVVDCSGRSGLYVYILIKRLAVEVDYDTAKHLGGLTLPWVDVWVQGNYGGVPGMQLATWFEKNILAFDYPLALSIASPTPLAPASPMPSRAPTPQPSPTVQPIVIQSAPVEEVDPMFGDVLFWLLVGHALADFVLQTDRMGQLKRPAARQPGGGPWWFWMTAHALIHGGAVALATGGRVDIGMMEFAGHFLIDVMPDRNPYIDQALHVLAKVAWAAYAVGTVR